MNGTLRTRLSVLLLTLAVGGFWRANAAVPVVAAYAFSSGSSSSDVTARTVNDLAFSFIRELRTFSILDMRAELPPADLGVPPGSDYIFYGSVAERSDGIRLELVLKGGPDSITRTISKVYENSNRILLESRMLVRDLFDLSIALPDPVAPDLAAVPADGQTAGTAPSTELPGIEDFIPVKDSDSLAGSWLGEAGVEKILILRGGRGIAVLETGVSLSLEVSASNGALLVRQKGSINPRQFADVTDSVAVQAASMVSPLEWILKLSRDQKRLVGVKKTASIKNDGVNVISVENRVVDVSWTRDR